MKINNLLKGLMIMSTFICSSFACAGEVINGLSNAKIASLYRDANAQAPNVLNVLNQAAIQQTANDTKKPKTPLVFVSLGMPDDLLRKILQDAARLEASVVIRGLYHNSFDATLKRLFSLMPKDEQEKSQWRGVMINPLWFREYNVTAVPAVAMTYDDDYDILFGNIALQEALTILKKHHHEVRA